MTPAESAHHQAIEQQGLVIEGLRQQYGFHPVSAEARVEMDEMRDRFLTLAIKVVQSVPSGRSRSLALTKLQEAKMWTIQALVDADGEEHG